MKKNPQTSEEQTSFSLRIFIKKNWFLLCTVAIISLAIILRFYNYPNRWGFAYDQAHDVIVARYALSNFKIPLLGPFSSAGAFQTGGEWYWFIMLGTTLYPFAIITPWLFLTVLYVLFVWLMILFGTFLINKTFGIIVGILAAVSTAQIAQSTNLTNQSPLALVSLFALWMMVKYIQSRKNIFAFFMSFAVSLGITIHLQGIGLFFIIVVSFIFRRPTLKNIRSLLFGFAVPFVPLIIYDISHNFYNFRGIVDYYLHGQYAIYVPNRWLTYLGVFWPNSWARIIGGEKVLSYIIMLLLLLLILYRTYRKTITKQIAAVFLTFLFIITAFRYYRGERIESYLVFTHPFILLLTGWVLVQVYSFNKYIGVFFLCLVVIVSLKVDYAEIRGATNYMIIKANGWSQLVEETYPQKKFALYDYGYRSAGYSLPLVLKLQEQQKLDNNGYKIGFGDPSRDQKQFHALIKGNKIGFELWDLNSSSSAQLAKYHWAPINPSFIYKATEEWYSKK